MDMRLWIAGLAICLGATSFAQTEISRDSFTEIAVNPQTDVKFVKGFAGNTVVSASNVVGDVCVRITQENGTLLRSARIDTPFASVDFCADLEVTPTGRIFVLSNSMTAFGERATVTVLDQDLNQVFQVHANNGNLRGIGTDLVFGVSGTFAIGVNVPDPVTPTAKVVGFSGTGEQEWIADAFIGVTAAHSVSKMKMLNGIEFVVAGQDEIGAQISIKKITNGTQTSFASVTPPNTKGAQVRDIEIEGERAHVLFSTTDLSTSGRKTFIFVTNTIPGVTEIQEIANPADFLLDGSNIVVLSTTGVITNFNLDNQSQTTFRSGLTGGTQLELFNGRYIVAFGRQYFGLNRTSFAIEATVTEPTSFLFRHLALSQAGSKLYLGFASTSGSSIVKVAGDSAFASLGGFNYRGANIPQLVRYIDSETDASGNLYVASQSTGGDQSSTITAFSQATGQILWRRNLSVVGSNFPFLKDISVDANGDVYWIGGLQDGSTFISIAQKLNALDGSEAWTQSSTDPGPNGLRFERIVVRGSQVSVVGPSGVSDFRALKLDKGTGNTLFNIALPGPAGPKATGDMVIDSSLTTKVMVFTNPRSNHRTLVQMTSDGTLSSRSSVDVDNFQASILRVNPLDVLYSANTRILNFIERFSGVNTLNSAAIPAPNDLQVSASTVLLGSDQGLDILNPTTGLLLRRFSFADTTSEKVGVDSREFVYGNFAHKIGGALVPNGSQLRKFRKNGAFLFNVASDEGTRASLVKALHIAPDFKLWAVSEENVQGNGSPLLTRLISQSQPPKALPDTFAGTEDVRLIVAAPGVLANDSDLTGSVLIPERLTNVPSTVGNVVVNANGSVVFTPKPNFSGTTSFTYRVRDEEGLFSPPVTVTLNIANVNDAPTASPDVFTVRKGQTLNVLTPGVLSNDADVDGDPLTAQLRSAVTAGSLTFRANGSFTFVAPPTAGTASFTYRVRDTSGLVSSDVTVTLNVID